MPASGGNPWDYKLHPSRTVEDQDVELKPIQMGTPPFSSPDPETDGVRMLPLEAGHGSAGHDEFAAFSFGEEPKNVKAKDFITAIKSAESEDQLDQIEEFYGRREGEPLSTVEEALEAKRAALQETDED